MVYIVVEVHNNGEFEGIYGIYTTLREAEKACELSINECDYPSELRIYIMEVE